MHSHRFGFVPVRLVILPLVVAFNICVMPLRAETITEGMQERIPQIIAYLNERNLKNVGVLKFRARKAGQKLSDSVGPINSLVADRLELGLILGNPFDEDQQLKIIEDASAQADQIDGANHLDETGRAKLFGSEFSLAWGNDRVQPDAFLTGVILLHENNLTARIGILCFDSSGGELERIGDTFEVELNARLLTEVGESYALRGLFDHGSTKGPKPTSRTQREKQAREQVIQIKQQRQPFPLLDSSAPIRLNIRYNGQPVAIEVRNGEAFVQEPTEGQSVEFELIRNPSASGTLGVSLRVNGENTLYRSPVSDFHGPKWILSPQHQRTLVRGYQLGDNRIEEFRVLSDQASGQVAVNYGRHVGQIQLTVFQQASEPQTPTFVDEEEEDLVAMLRGVRPSRKPKNLGALKAQLRTAGREGPQTRGLVVGGAQGENKIRKVAFRADPVPVMSATLTYYRR